jgi:hypothetical protein
VDCGHRQFGKPPATDERPDVQIEMLATLLDRAEFKAFSFAMLDPALESFRERNAGGGRRKRRV